MSKPIPSVKFCPHCGRDRPLADFSLCRGKPRWVCQDCFNAWTRQWRKDNPQRARATDKRYKDKSKPKRSRDYKVWLERNKGRRKILWAQYYQKNHERMLARARKYRAENLKRVKQKNKLYRENNLDKHRAYEATRRAAKFHRGPWISYEEWQTIMRYFDHRCGYCLEKAIPLTQEHMTPLSRGGKHDVENVVPACMSCNNHKSSKNLIQYALGTQ